MIKKEITTEPMAAEDLLAGIEPEHRFDPLPDELNESLPVWTVLHGEAAKKAAREHNAKRKEARGRKKWLR